MKKIVLTAIILSAAGICFTACNRMPVHRSVEATAAVKIAEKKNIIVLDVRTPDEFSQGHLRNAINIDFLDASFAEKIASLDKKKKYLVYCRSGNRSTQAMEAMKTKGFRNVTNMLGGITAWPGEMVQ